LNLKKQNGVANTMVTLLAKITGQSFISIP